MHDNSQHSQAMNPLLSWTRPWWLVVLGVMLGFGLLQEQAKIKVNHYLRVGDEAKQDMSFWRMDESERAEWWSLNSPVGRHNFYVSQDTWPWFHGMDRFELVAFKWGLSAVILLVFFGFDVLFLRAMGVPERMPWLLLIYGACSLPMLGLAMSEPGRPWYALAREFLGFLQSPLPSLMVVAMPWMLARLSQES